MCHVNSNWLKWKLLRKDHWRRVWYLVLMCPLAFHLVRERLTCSCPLDVVGRKLVLKTPSSGCIICGSTIPFSRMFVAGEWLWCFFFFFTLSIFDGFFSLGTLMLIAIVWENFMLVSVCGHKLSMKTIFNYWLESLWRIFCRAHLVFWGCLFKYLFSVSVFFFVKRLASICGQGLESLEEN